MHASQAEHDWNLLQTCISLLEHIGDFRLNLADLEKKIGKSIQEKKTKLDDDDNSVSYLCSHHKISSKGDLTDFQKLVEKSQQHTGIFSDIFDAVTPICEYIHDTMLAAIFMPIEHQLKGAQFENDENLELSGNDLPDYSFAPQEFITVIGQVSENIVNVSSVLQSRMVAFTTINLAVSFHFSIY